MDPIVFWEHSLGCALVCRQFARKINFVDPGKAYLAGLLHDIGIIAHLWVLPHEFPAALELAQSQHIPLHEAELSILGVTHCETGKMSRNAGTSRLTCWPWWAVTTIWLVPPITAIWWLWSR